MDTDETPALAVEDAAMNETEMQTVLPAPIIPERVRPRLAGLVEATGEGDSKKKRVGVKSMFGLALGTLKRAKVEDKERNASEAAKKRQLIDARLQTRLRAEVDDVRKADEVKKDKLAANRREEDITLLNSIHKLSHTRLPLLSHFLATSDIIPIGSPDDSIEYTSIEKMPVSLTLPRSHPPPIYYLPALLTPTQSKYIEHRKRETLQFSEERWNAWTEERKNGVAEVEEMRRKVKEFEEERRQKERGKLAEHEVVGKISTENHENREPEIDADVDMDVDASSMVKEVETKKETKRAAGDDEDEVEY